MNEPESDIMDVISKLKPSSDDTYLEIIFKKYVMPWYRLKKNSGASVYVRFNQEVEWLKAGKHPAPKVKSKVTGIVLKGLKLGNDHL